VEELFEARKKPKGEAVVTELTVWRMLNGLTEAVPSWSES